MQNKLNFFSSPLILDPLEQQGCPLTDLAGLTEGKAHTVRTVRVEFIGNRYCGVLAGLSEQSRMCVGHQAIIPGRPDENRRMIAIRVQLVGKFAPKTFAEAAAAEEVFCRANEGARRVSVHERDQRVRQNDEIRTAGNGTSQVVVRRPL